MTPADAGPTPAAARRPLFVGLDDAARMVGLSRRTLSRWIAAGELPVRRVGRRVLVTPADLAERVEGRPAPS
jgi:excisionase family DNA binding protein